jgi:hypothetical protein
MEVSGQLHRGKSPWYPLDRRLGGPSWGSGGDLTLALDGGELSSLPPEKELPVPVG